MFSKNMKASIALLLVIAMTHDIWTICGYRLINTHHIYQITGNQINYQNNILLCENVGQSHVSVNNWNPMKQMYSRTGLTRLFYRKNKSKNSNKSEMSNNMDKTPSVEKKSPDKSSWHERAMNSMTSSTTNWQQSQTGAFVSQLNTLANDAYRNNLGSRRNSTDGDYSNDIDDSRTSQLSKGSIIESGSLSTLLDNHLPQMSHSMLSATLYSLGMLKYNKAIRLQTKDLNQLLRSFRILVNQMNPEEMTLSILGLARLQVSFRDIVKEQPDFLSYLVPQLTKTSTKQYSDILWSLASLGCQWNMMNPHAKVAFMTVLSKQILQFDKFSLASITWAFAKMGAKWHEFQADDRVTIIDQLYKYGKDLSPQQASKVIWALGSLGCSSMDISNDFIDILISNVNNIKRSQIGNAVSAGQTLTGIAKLGLHWRDLSKVVRNGLWEQLIRVSMSPNDKALSNAIWAMGTIEAPFEQQPRIVFESMIDSARRVLGDCSAWSLCNIVWGFSKMGFSWNDFDNNFQESIVMNIGRISNQMKEIDVGILLWSLGELDAPMDTFSNYILESLYEAIVRNIDDMNSQEISRTLWGLSGSGIAWDKLPTGLKWKLNASLRRVSSSMSPQDIANSAYAFAILSFDSENTYDAIFRGIHETLLSTIQALMKKYSKLQEESFNETSADRQQSYVEDNAFVKSINRVFDRQSKDEFSLSSSIIDAKEIEQLRIFASYLVALQRVSDTSRIPSQLMEPYRSNSQSISSNLQKDVILSLADSLKESQFLNQGNFDIAIEYSSFEGVFPVDAAVLRENVLISLIEVDGPHHYRYDGLLRRKDQLKEAMYQSMFPDVLFRRIRWDEKNKLGAQAITDELASSIVLHSRKVTPLTGALRKIEQQFSAFFSWSLRREQNF